MYQNGGHHQHYKKNSSQTAEEREARLQYGEELVEGGVLHRRLQNSERHAMSTSLDVVNDTEQTHKNSFTAHSSGNRYLCSSTIEGKSQLPRSVLDRSRSPIMQTLC